MGPCTSCVLIPCAAQTVWIAGGRLWLTEILRIHERFPCNSLAKKLTPLIFPNSTQVPSSAMKHPRRRQAKVEEREESSCVPPNFPFNWWRALPHHPPTGADDIFYDPTPDVLHWRPPWTSVPSVSLTIPWKTQDQH